MIGNKFQSFSVLSAIVCFTNNSHSGALLMISGRLFVLKSKKIRLIYSGLTKVLICFFFYGLLIGFGCFPIPASNKNTDIKVGGLITTLIYLFLIYGSLKLFYKHFQLKKLNIHKS
jgi:hypothetical protein